MLAFLEALSFPTQAAQDLIRRYRAEVEAADRYPVDREAAQAIADGMGEDIEAIIRDKGWPL
jgi:hypothetical protein